MHSSRAAAATDDLSTLAWVLEELRKSLETAHKALRRYLRDVEAASGSDLDDVDPAVLRAARQQIHQSMGVLELVNVAEGALLLRASEALVQRFVAKPQRLDADGVAAVEHASFALLDYLSRRLAGKATEPLGLFPALRGLQERNGAERVHPADLWFQEWHWREVPPLQVTPRPPNAPMLASFERHLLSLVRTNALDHAVALRSDCCAIAAHLSAHTPGGAHEAVTMWRIAGAFFEAWALNLLPQDVFVKRTASRVLAQLRAMGKGDLSPSDRLAQDLLFYCARASLPVGAASPCLQAVRSGYGLDAAASGASTLEAVDYNASVYGRFDPAAIAQARKRVDNAKQSFALVAGGELTRLAVLPESFALVREALQSLYPTGCGVGEALHRVASQAAAQMHMPEPAVSMEVATSLLYLDAVLEDGDFDQPAELDRLRHLAYRLDALAHGEAAQPLEPWMEALYRRVSDRHTLGSVVHELRDLLKGVESKLDQFFRAPDNGHEILGHVPSALADMRGVFAVLGVDAAERTVSRMRDDVLALCVPGGHFEADRPEVIACVQRLTSNLGALGFLVDMLHVQPPLAKMLFMFDGKTGLLAPLMGRHAAVPGLIDRAQAISEAASRPDIALADVSADLHDLASQPLVEEVPDLALSLQSARAAIEEATVDRDVYGAEYGDASRDESAREHVMQAMSDFMSAATSPAPLDALETHHSLPAPLDTAEISDEDLAADPELREIFLEEANEVMAQAHQSLAVLSLAPADVGQLTVLRRAFHTLKGSARMVGLKRIGEAAWSCEQLYNHWLAIGEAASPSLQVVTEDAVRYFDIWAEAVAADTAAHILPDPVVAAADALRLAGECMRIEMPSEPATRSPSAAPQFPEATPLDPFMPLMDDPSAARIRAAAKEALPTVDLSDPSQDPGLVTPSSLPSALVDLEIPDVHPVSVMQSLEASLPMPLDRSADVDLDIDIEAPFEPVPAAGHFDIDLHLDTESKHVPLFEPGDDDPLDLDLDMGPVDGADGGVDRSLSVSTASPSPVPLDISQFLPSDLSLDLSASLPPTPNLVDADNAFVPTTTPAAYLTEPPDFDLDVSVGEPEENVRVIGTLRVPAELFGIYTAEADEVSRQLATELDEWAMELPRPVAESTIALAHSLGGSSATVGYEDLCTLARELESALERTHHNVCTFEDVALFQDGSHEIRRLLQQFSAGFLREPDDELMARLRAWPAVNELPDLLLDDPQSSLLLDAVDIALDDVPLAAVELSELSDLSDVADMSVEALAPPVVADEPPADPAPLPAMEPADADVPDVVLATSLGRLLDAAGQEVLLDAEPVDELSPRVSAPQAAEPGLDAEADGDGSGEGSVHAPPVELGAPVAPGTLTDASPVPATDVRKPSLWGAALAGAAALVGLGKRHEASARADASALPAAPEATSPLEDLRVDTRRGDEPTRARDEPTAAPLLDDPTSPSLDQTFDIDLDVPGDRPISSNFAPFSASVLPVLDEVVDLEDDDTPPEFRPSQYPPDVDLVHELKGARSAELTTFPPHATPTPHRPEPVRPDPVVLRDVVVLEALQTDIDQRDQIDAELFPLFEEEADDLLPQLALQVQAWQASPHDQDVGSACMRLLHTFKGGARLAGAMRLGEMAHRCESAIQVLMNREHVDPEDLNALQGRIDTLSHTLERVRRQLAGESLSGFQPFSTEVGAWATRAGSLSEFQLDHSDVARPDEPEDAYEADIEPVPQVPPINWARLADVSAHGAAAAPGALAHAAERVPTITQPVRVRIQVLDRLVNLAGEVNITRARLDSEVGQIRGAVADLADNLDRLNQQLHDIALQADTQLQSRREAARVAAQDFDPLELDRYTRLQELTRILAESVNDVATVRSTLMRTVQSTEDELASQARLTRELQSDLLRTRMVEFDSLSDRLYRVVRQAAKETGKLVRLDIVGGSIEVDRSVLDRMVPAFEHLLRNCVTHGVELPIVRQSAGKDQNGRVVISVEQEGNEVAVEVRDDGAGLDLTGIRERAQAMGLIQPDATLSDKELAQMILLPGLSTAIEVTELAGRGVGMDVVRADVQAMGGRVEIRTEAGQGTRFKLVLPLTTVVTQVVMLRCGTSVIAVPSNLIELVQRATPQAVETAYGASEYLYGGLRLPFFWLGALLGQKGVGSLSGRTLPVVILRSAQHRVALHVDDVQGTHEVVVKPLGPQLVGLPGLSGLTMLPTGQVALIYNPVTLSAVYGQRAHEMARLALSAPADADLAARLDMPPQAPLVLVVDDSLTVRRITKRLLEREGYRVALAKDGLEALDLLGDERPVVVLSDIEMPRMDGFDLLRNIRSDALLSDLPVLMITSRIAEKHRDHAIRLGANHYLGKPYSEDELLGLIRRYAPRPKGGKAT